MSEPGPASRPDWEGSTQAQVPWAPGSQGARAAPFTRRLGQKCPAEVSVPDDVGALIGTRPNFRYVPEATISSPPKRWFSCEVTVYKAFQKFMDLACLLEVEIK